jgi:hypothetical protein
MFQHIRKHQKWLWIVISGAVIISFVWYFGPSQRAAHEAGGGGNSVVGTIDGEPITYSHYAKTRNEAVLQYLFNYGEWPVDNEVTRQLRPIERETRTRLLLLDRLQDYKIKVSEKDVADWIATVFQDRETKQFHKEFYDRFVAQLPPKGLTAEDFRRYAEHQVGIMHLASLAGAPGKLVTPQEAEQEFRHVHEKAVSEVVLFNSSNYFSKVDMSSNLLTRFYTNRAANYRLPERVQVSYVAFPASNYYAQAETHIAGITNLAAEIDNEYAKRGPNFYTDSNGQPLGAEAAKAKIRDELKHQSALVEARRAAIDFATALEPMPIKTNSPNPAENLENLAQAKNLRTHVSQPFAQGQEPSDMNVPSQFSRVAFNLSAEEPIITEPVVGEDTVYVVAFKRRIPSELPSFESVKQQVVDDYRRSEALRLCREAGQAFATSVTNALASGKSFEAAAQAAGYSVTKVPPFDRDPKSSVEGLPPQLDASSLRANVFDLTPGHASSYVPAREGGYVAYLEKLMPASEEETKKELPQFVEELRRRGASEAFNHWLTKQMQLANLTLQGDRNTAED